MAPFMACLTFVKPLGATLRLAQRGRSLPQPGGTLSLSAARQPHQLDPKQRHNRAVASRAAACWPRAAAAAPRAAAQPPPPPSQSLSRSSLLRAGVLALGAGSPLFPGEPNVRAAAMSTSAAAATAGGAAPSASPSGAIVVYVTVPSAEVGESLASKLVESQLAACVNLLPGVTSIYSWKGKVEKDAELLLIIKSRSELLPELTAFVRANHPYDEPEVVGLPILGGSVSYLQWLMDNTRGAAATAGAGAGVEAAGAAGQGPAAGKA